MADRKNNFGGAADSARGAESAIDHAGIAISIIGSGHSPAQKMDMITNHPTMPTAIKNQALDTITKMSGGGGVSPSVTEATAAREKQSSGGAASSTPAPQKRANPFPEGSALHEYHNINPNPHAPNIRPSKIHSTYSAYTETDIPITPQQAHENNIAQKATEEFDAIQRVKAQQARSEKAGRTPGVAGATARTKMPKVTARTRGVNVTQTIGTNEFAQKLTGAHAQLTHMANSLHGLNVSPEAQYGLNAAKNNLSEGLASINQGNNYKDGYKEGNKVYKSSEAAHPHYVTAHGKLQKAHDLLADRTVQAELSKNNISAELPTGTLEELKGHIPSLPVAKKSAKPYSRMKTGRYQSITAEELKDETSAKSIENIEKVTGKDSRLSQRGRATLRGFPRKNKFIARIENRKVSDADLAKPATEENPLPKPTGGVPRSEDPRARSSDARVDVNFTGGTPTEGKMPTFEGSVGGKKATAKNIEAVKNDPNNPALKPDPAKSKPRQNRGGKGGAV
jgi:hypothetical protein